MIKHTNEYWSSIVIAKPVSVKVVTDKSQSVVEDAFSLLKGLKQSRYFDYGVKVSRY